MKFDSGAKVINAMASGDVDIALAGSSPIAAGVSHGIDMQLFWIVEDIAAAEALVVRDGSGIDLTIPSTLKGKKLGVPFVSTTHFHTLFALERWGIDPSEVELLNMQPNQIAAAWERGDIDAAFVWDPALGRIKKSGKVMITSGELSRQGQGHLRRHGRQCASSPRTIRSSWRSSSASSPTPTPPIATNKAAWTADSPEVQANVTLVGGEPADVPGVLDALRLSDPGGAGVGSVARRRRRGRCCQGAALSPPSSSRAGQNRRVAG